MCVELLCYGAMFDLKQLQCFVAVGEELHFGRAATRMNMTQPPLSRQIQLLEHDLQLQLLSRTSRSVRLTFAGRSFLREAVRILATVEAASAAAKRIARGQSGVLRLGFTAGSSYEFLPKLLSRANTALKDIELVLTEMVSKQQLEALSSNSIDMGLQRMPIAREGVERICVARERMVVAVPRAHRLARGKLPSLEDLAGEPLIMFSPLDGYYFYHLIDALFARMPVPPRYIQHVSQIHSILALVSAGLGMALVPESARLLRYKGVMLRRMRQPLPPAELHLVWNRATDNPAVATVEQIVRQHFAIPEHAR